MFKSSLYSTAVAVLVGGSVSLIGSAAACCGPLPEGQPTTARWSPEERTTLRSLALSSLPPLPRDPTNKFADDPRAAALGERLFSDSRLSVNGQVACATCHVPSRDFQDGVALSRGVGTTTRRTMPVAGTAYSPWLFWDGRADSQWAQALGPLESAVEHGGTRLQYAQVVSEYYRDAYEAVFGALPSLTRLPAHASPVGDDGARMAWQRIPPARQTALSRVYANIGKAIAAYERGIGFTPTRFDRWVDAELSGTAQSASSLLARDELAGLRLFIGKAGCLNCHNGPRFTDDHFHNTGVRARTTLPPDSGRTTGVVQAVASEFNCLGQFSDAMPDDCGELRFATTDGPELLRAYKTPSLRGVAERAPYMHAGQMATLAEVIVHYDHAPKAVAGHSELRPLKLSSQEKQQIEAFLRTLSPSITDR